MRYKLITHRKLFNVDISRGILYSMSLADELRTRIKGEIDDTPATLEIDSKDAGLFKMLPQVVVSPRDADDVASLVRFATEKKTADPHLDISLTARSAGTDMTGGPINTSIIMNMLPHFNRILEVGEGFSVVEPGVFYRDFDTATQKKGWELPSYTASRDINTVGGMVANDSGGEKNLKYGKTDRYIEELEVILADGEKHILKNLEGDALAQKLQERSFEGDLYRNISALITKNRALIERARPQVSKNSSGYALWEAGDGVRSLNLARLICGSQGTLGIVTRIRFSLVHPKKYSAMVICMLDNLAELGPLVPEVLQYEPDSFESFDDKTFKLAVKYFPEFALQMKMGLVSLGFAFLPEMWMILTGGVPKLLTMAEFRADTQEEALAKAEKLAVEIQKNNPHIGVRIAKNERAARKFWVIRRESFNLLRKKVRGMRTAPFFDDFVIPTGTMVEFLPKLQEILSHYDLMYTVAGHIGDGNFHIIPLIDPKRPGVAETLDELSHKVYDLVLGYHGSITGEHNDGLVRTPYVEKMFGSDMYRLFIEVKKIFDPLNIFNPGKKVGMTFAEAMKHIDLDT